MLALALAAQLAVPADDPDLPDGAVARFTRFASFAVPPVALAPDIMRAPIFAPDRGAAVGASAVEDFVLLGTVVSRHGASAAIRLADGRVTTVGVGGHVGLWRLRMVARNRAGFERAGALRTLVVGAGGAGGQAPPPATDGGE